MPEFASGGVSIHVDELEPANSGANPAILLLHGSGGNVSFWFERIAPLLRPLNVGLYAVHYFNRTGTTRADRQTILDGYHFNAWIETIGDALAYVRARPGVDAGRVAVLGISLGAFLALSVATESRAEIRAVVEISGGMPETFMPKVNSAFPPTLILHGEADTVVPVSMARELEALLATHKVPHQSLILAGQGHWFDGRAQEQILRAAAGFLATHL